MPPVVQKEQTAPRKTAAGTFSACASKVLSSEEATTRRAAVETARGLLAIEGLAPSLEARTDDDAWVRGELTMEEKIERTRARARVIATRET